MVLSTALFGKPAFRNLICNGLVLAEDGKKMSKSLKNYPSPMEVIDDYGAVSSFFYLFYHFYFVLCYCYFLFLRKFEVSLSLKVYFLLTSGLWNIVSFAGCLAAIPYKLACCTCWAIAFQEGRSLWCCEYFNFIFHSRLFPLEWCLILLVILRPCVVGGEDGWVLRLTVVW